MTNFLTRFWFPLTLIGLLVLAAPGVVLFALNIFGQEGAVNRFLENAFQLSYHVPIPWWGALLLLLIPFLIVLLYFLKLKRKPLSVPSTFLWRKSIEDLHVNSFFQWLRENVLLLLQVLAVLALIYGVMAFQLHGRKSTGKHYILMVDNSASMGAVDVKPNRLEKAKQEALKEIGAAGDGDIGMVIEFNSSAVIRQSYTSDRAVLRQAVRGIAASERPTRIDEALSLADSLANPHQSTDDASVRPAGAEPGKERTYVAPEGIPTEIHLFSDGRFSETLEFSLGNLNVRYHAIGQLKLMPPADALASANVEPVPAPTPESTDNVAIVNFNALRDERDPSLFRVLVRALNFRKRGLAAKVQLEVLRDGAVQRVYDAPLTLEARTIIQAQDPNTKQVSTRDAPGEGFASFELGEIDDQPNVVLRAQLVGVVDNFPLDNEAWLVIGAVRKARVLIVSPGNEVLQAFFAGAATTEVAWMTPAELAAEKYLKPARDGAYDLVVYDRCGPSDEHDMPRSNTFFIGYPPPPWKWQTGEKIEPGQVVERVDNPHIKGWMGKRPLLRYLSALYDVGLSEAFKMKDLPPNTPRLIETDHDMAVLLSLTRGPFTDLVMTFPILNDKNEWNTNWPLLPSFPIFLRNVLYTLGHVSDAAIEENVQPGQVKILRPSTSVREGTVTTPRGQEVPLLRNPRDPRPEFSFGATENVGMYRVRWENGAEGSFAVNLFSAEESNIEPRPVIQIGAESVAAGKERSQPRETREIWKWFALAALIVLLVEWYIYNRRVYV